MDAQYDAGGDVSAFRLQRLDHISLNVGDRERSIAWYRDVLGLAQRGTPGRDDWPVFMGEFGASVALFQAQGPPAKPVGPEEAGLRHVAFMVSEPDLRRALAHLERLGVEHRFEDHGTTHSVYFADPDGNRIELTTYDVG